MRTGKAAFELHGRQVATREAQSRRLGGGREVIGVLVAGSECVVQGPRRLIADPATRIRGGKVTCCLGSEEEAHSLAHPHTAGGRGPRGNEIRLALVCYRRNRFFLSAFLNARSSKGQG